MLYAVDATVLYQLHRAMPHDSRGPEYGPCCVSADPKTVDGHTDRHQTQLRTVRRPYSIILWAIPFLYINTALYTDWLAIAKQCVLANKSWTVYILRRAAHFVT